MSRWLLVILLSSLAWAATRSVEIRRSEVWVITDGAARQLTNDGKAKLQAVLSPLQDRVAYYNECPVQEHCVPSLVILDLAGRKLGSFMPQGKSEGQGESRACTSILFIWWTKPSSIAAECHIDPSLSEYIETNIGTGKTTRDLMGYWFVPSHDGNMVAHVGWVPHFAPPFARSNYLQIGDQTIYPVPKDDDHPVKQNGFPPYEPRQRGLSYFGIHEFETAPAWSPDVKHIGLIDCVYDWTAAGPELTTGTESNRRCLIAVVSRRGESKLIPLERHPFQGVQLQWTDSKHLQLTVAGKRTKLLNLPALEH